MRYAPLSGVAAAGLLVAGLAENNTPTSDSDATITAWLAGGHNGGWIGHGLLLGAAGIALLLFAYSLRARLTGDRPGLGASLLTATGGLLTASVLLGAALFAALPIGHLLESSPTASAETYRLSMALCTAVMFVFSMIPAATLAITAATIGLRCKTMPAWLAVVSYRAGRADAGFRAPRAVPRVRRLGARHVDHTDRGQTTDARAGSARGRPRIGIRLSSDRHERTSPDPTGSHRGYCDGTRSMVLSCQAGKQPTFGPIVGQLSVSVEPDEVPPLFA